MYGMKKYQGMRFLFIKSDAAGQSGARVSHRPTKWNDAQHAEWKVPIERAYRKMVIFVDLRHGQETLGNLTAKNIN